MARLIDADALKKYMCFKCNDEYSDEPCEPSDCGFRNAIGDAPTVDAVEVVRCKDCRYRIFDNVTQEWFCNSVHSGFVYAKCNDFCSYGERKTE